MRHSGLIGQAIARAFHDYPGFVWVALLVGIPLIVCAFFIKDDKS